MTDYETFAGVETSYTSEHGLTVLPVQVLPDAVWRGFFSSVRDHWPVNMPKETHTRLLQAGFPAESMTAV